MTGLVLPFGRNYCNNKDVHTGDERSKRVFGVVVVTVSCRCCLGAKHINHRHHHHHHHHHHTNESNIPRDRRNEPGRLYCQQESTLADEGPTSLTHPFFRLIFLIVSLSLR